MERNNILHLRTAGDMNGLEIICLDNDVTAQYNLGYDNLDEEDHYLLDNEKSDLL